MLSVFIAILFSFSALNAQETAKKSLPLLFWLDQLRIVTIEFKMDVYL